MPEVLYEMVDDVAWITINRPDARNALNSAAREGLFSAFRRFDADVDANIAILTGAGEAAFCAGGDLKEMADMALKVPPHDFVPHLGYNIHTAKPVIAAVNGHALAGGFLMAQMCDLVVAADHAQFGISEARWGRGAPWAAPLPWLIPPRVALELLMTAEPISAQRAYEVGLVNCVVPITHLRDTAQALARRIADNAPLSVRAGKAMVYEAAERGRSGGFAAGDRFFEAAYLSDDAQEGPRAFREKRKPQWKGR